MSARAFLEAAELPDNDSDDGVDEWVALFATRDEMAAEYAKLLRAHTPSWSGWPALNGAIIARWSKYGLGYIKSKAWDSIHA